MDNLSDPIFRDKRGEIRRYDVGNVKFNVITTKAGVFRGGDHHKVKQYILILKGEFEITYREDGKDVVVKKGPNQLIEFSPDVPHLFKSLTDSVMIEWWDGSFDVEYYEPYRKFITNQ